MQWWKITRQVHVSWLIAWFCLFIVFGVSIAQNNSGWNTLGWLLVGITGASLVLWKRAVYLIPIICVAGCVIGLWRGSIDEQQLTVYHALYDQQLTISGTVADDVDTGKNGEAVIRLQQPRSNQHTLPGKLWISSSTKYDIKRGDNVTVYGKLLPGFGNFAGTMYRASVVKVQRPQPGDVARQVRDWFADAIRRAVPDPQAALGIGYLVGQRRALPEELSSALQIAGLTHIVVASGYNLTILVRLSRRIFITVSKYLSALTASGMIVVFIGITGLSPSMSRAGLVSGLSLAAWYYGRRFHPLVLLPFAAAITVLIEPSYVWGDLGWQLSFAAFAGVMILAPLLQRYFFGEKEHGIVRQILGETISATIVTLPILIGSFSQVSNVAIIANLLVLPFVPLAMLLTFIAGVGAIVVPNMAEIVGLPASWLLGYMVHVTEFLAKIPWAISEIKVPQWTIGAAYIGIILVTLYLWRATRLDLREKSIIE